MLKRLQIEALNADHAMLTSLVGDRSQEQDPIGYYQFASRLNVVEKEIKQLKDEPRENAEVALFFGGKPVIGSRGIMADFGAKAIEKFQDAVSTRYAALEGPVGARGPVKQRDKSHMLLTNFARGSFGFVLEEIDQEDLGARSNFRESVEEVVDLIYRCADPDLDVFDEAAEYLDDRVIASMSNFLRHIDDAGATLRVVNNEKDFLLQRDAIERARERIESASISEITRELRGVLYMMPSSRKFELHERGDEVIKGSISNEGWRELTDDQERLKDGVLGQMGTIKLSIREIKLRGQFTRYVYRLIGADFSGRMPRL